MLNNFCFHVFTQKSLFMAENCNAFFYIFIITINRSTLPCEFTLHRAGSQLKNVWKSDRRWEPGIPKFDDIENWKWSLGHAEQLLFSCLFLSPAPVSLYSWFPAKKLLNWQLDESMLIWIEKKNPNRKLIDYRLDLCFNVGRGLLLK